VLLASAQQLKDKKYARALLKVGVVGLGTVGSRVAARLADAGSLHFVYNRTHSKAEVFANAHGARHTKTAAELAKACDLIITVLSNDDAVRETFAAFAEIEVRGKTFLEMSTIAPSVSASLSSELKKRGASMLDVPVVGSAPMVERGEAVLLVGGDGADFEKVGPLLRKISKEVLYVGQNGSGLRLKLVHNLVLGSYVVALGEAVHFGLGGGLDPALIEKLLVSLSSVRSPNSALKVPKILNSDYSPQFSLKHMIKDLGLIGTEARLQGSAIPLGATALQLYTLAKKRGFSDEDFSVVAELFKREPAGKRE
jgi:3-hydroxyisobutyrate dehydrogenase